MGSDFANGAFLFADVNVPTGTTLLKLDYDQLDSAIAFEGLWYLAYGWNWGPMTMIVHLPSDASIVRYEGASFATQLDSHTLKFVIPDGTAFYDTVVYSTTSVPNLYDTITSPHFQVFLPSVYRQYSDRIVSLLENAYILFSQYSGQDVNQLANQTHYDYYFPPGGWYWWGSTITLWGGLTVLGGPSAVSSRFIPDINFTVGYGYNFLMAIMYHELGNGWWLLMSNGGLPWWVNGEGHSGFLRSQAELDMNYCADAQREHQNHYQDYSQCMKAPPSGNHCNEEIILVSLLQKYGWQPLRNIYASVWNGSLNLNGLSADEKDSQMVLFFSQQVNQNLVSFFRSQRIYVSPQVESALSSLPVGNVPIISALSCRTPPIMPTVVSSVAADANPTNAASVNFTMTFSRYVSGVDASDFTLTTTGVTGASISTVNGSGTTYTVIVNTGSSNGTIRLDVIDDDSIIDGINPLGGIGAGNGDYTSDETYMIVKTQTFADVLYTHWAYFWIDRLYAAGITSGCGTNPLTYCPDNPVTRAQMAVFLERGIHGSAYQPPAVGAGTGFNDVATSYWAAAWIKQLYVDGITSGCGGGNYCPDNPVTRSQMAVFLLRAEYGVAYIPPGVGSNTGFNDVPVTYWAAAWIKQLAAEGITTGCGSGIYCPEDTVTRAQMAVFLVRTFNLP
jgi:hypothetical protein